MGVMGREGALVAQFILDIRLKVVVERARCPLDGMCTNILMHCIEHMHFFHNLPSTPTEYSKPFQWLLRENCKY